VPAPATPAALRKSPSLHGAPAKCKRLQEIDTSKLKPQRATKRPKYYEEDSSSPSTPSSSSTASPAPEIEALEVLTDGDWWEAHSVAERADGYICVRYVGGSPSEDEWVPRNSARIRQPQDPARIAKERRCPLHDLDMATSFCRDPNPEIWSSMIISISRYVVSSIAALCNPSK
jgi:hypothetical protein